MIANNANNLTWYFLTDRHAGKMRQTQHVRKMGFRNQLLLAFSIGIVIMALVSSLAISELSKRAVRERLVEEGLKTTENFAEQSTLALLYQSADNARDFAEATLALPDIVGVGIFDQERIPVLVLGRRGNLDRRVGLPKHGSHLVSETSKSWHFSSPVYANKPSSDQEDSPFEASTPEPEFLGYAQVILSKKTLNQLSRNIYVTNLSVSAVLALFLVSVLIWLTTRITRPLNTLSKTMHRAELGEQTVRAEISGTREVVEMGTAFNTMMQFLEEREAQLRAARDDLEARVQERTEELAHSNQELHQEIAERKLIERQLIDAKETAVKASHAKSVFLSNMSHELRTPLNAVIGYSEMMLEESDDNNLREFAPDLEKINDAGRHLLALISEILNLARIESGKMDLNINCVNLNKISEDSLSIMYPIAEKRSIQIRDNLAEIKSIEVDADETRLKEILLNLLSNAVKYNSAQGNIELRVDDREDEVVVHVIDDGPGLSEEEIKELFEPFNRLKAGDEIEGTGIGLTITKRLIEMMHGHIGVVSEPGKGSDFWISLPKAGASHAALFSQNS